jgi:hypothetical protein
MTPAPPKDVGGSAIRRRSALEVRWRQFRGAPRPVVRAVASSLAVGTVLALAYLVYDVALSRGARLPGGDLRIALAAAVVLAILLSGSALTYLVVPQPRGAGGGPPRRSVWSAVLGFFAAVPIAYLVLVVEAQILRPLLG